MIHTLIMLSLIIEKLQAHEISTFMYPCDYCLFLFKHYINLMSICHQNGYVHFRGIHDYITYFIYLFDNYSYIVQSILHQIMLNQ